MLWNASIASSLQTLLLLLLLLLLLSLSLLLYSKPGFRLHSIPLTVPGLLLHFNCWFNVMECVCWLGYGGWPASRLSASVQFSGTATNRCRSTDGRLPAGRRGRACLCTGVTSEHYCGSGCQQNVQWTDFQIYVTIDVGRGSNLVTCHRYPEILSGK